MGVSHGDLKRLQLCNDRPINIIWTRSSFFQQRHAGVYHTAIWPGEEINKTHNRVHRVFDHLS